MGRQVHGLRSADMFHSLAAILLSIGLGGGFGEGSAEVVSIDSESMLVSVEVEAVSTAQSVVASFFAPGDEPVTLPLLHRGGNRYGLQTELRPVDYTVVFEVLGPDPEQSAPVQLSAMGADFGAVPVATLPPTEEDDGFSPAAKRWGWLALALAAASLAVLAFWVLGDKDRAKGEEHPDDDGDSSDAEADATRYDGVIDASSDDGPAGETR